MFGLYEVRDGENVEKLLVNKVIDVIKFWLLLPPYQVLKSAFKDVKVMEK